MGQVRSAATVKVYEEMWESFSQWCAGQAPPITLEALNPGHLQAFRGSRTGVNDDDISARHALRQLRLIDQVLLHRSKVNPGPKNTAASDAIASNPQIKYADAGHTDTLPRYLDARTAKELVVFLSACKPRRDAGGPKLSWQLVRNRVAVSLQLGAGLGPTEVRLLTLNAPVITGGKVKGRPWKLKVPATGDSPQHEAPLAAWAGELLEYWLSVRSEQGIEGVWLFPSTRTGKPWGKGAQYLAAKAVMEDAGLTDAPGGSFMLRHTFALRQLRRATAPSEVARWMGITDPKVMERYAPILHRPPDVV